MKHKALITLAFLALISCSRDNLSKILEDASKGSVKLSVNLGNFFIGGSGADSPWNHQYQENAEITFSSTTSVYTNTVSFNPNDLSTFPETNLPYDTYSWTITKTGDDVAVSDVLYIYGSSAGDFTVDSPTTTVPLVLDTDFALVTVSTENLTSASIRYNGTNTDLTTQDGYYFGYINTNNTSYILQIISTDDLAGMDTISDPVAYTHYNYQVTFDTPTTGSVGISLSLSQNFVIEDRDITAEADDDLDGVPNSLDQCPGTSTLEVADENGCGPSQHITGICPQPVYPVDGASSIPVNTTISWTPSQGVTAYLISIGLSPGSSDIINGTSTGQNTFFTPPQGLPENTIIYVNLSVFILSQGTSTCTTYSFTTQDTQAPTAITDLSATNLTDVSVTLNWTASSDNVGVVNYEIFQDGVSIGNSGTNTTFNVTGLTNATTYIFNVVAQDVEGNSSEVSNSVEVSTFDSEAPSAITDLTATNVTHISAKLNWSPSTDNVGVVNYEIFQDGVSIANSGTNTTFNVTGLTTATNYTFNVVAQDAAGNISEVSNDLIVTTIDVVSPSAPTDLIASNITSTSVDLNWTASTDNVGIVTYGIYQDGVSIGYSGTDTTFNVTGLTSGTTYFFTVSAQDASGNESELSTGVDVITLSN